jgi:hypothetical protein
MGLDMYLYQKETHEVAYWRKANAIHGWIINATGVVDDGTPVHLSKQLVIQLRDTCAEVIRVGTTEYAEEVLPPTSGFFFGSSEIDEWYWNDIKSTAEKLTEIIDNSIEDQEFEYYASW